MSERERGIQLFDAFKTALVRLCKDDYVLFSTQRKKSPVTHRIAMYIEAALGGGPDFICDTLFHVQGEQKRGYTPDILVHDRLGHIHMALFWQDGYLNAAQREEARDFHKEKKCLTLAFSLLPDKDYFLIYRFAGSYTDYLHLSREDFSEVVLKRCGEDEDLLSADQLMLDLPRSRKRKPRQLKEGEVIEEPSALLAGSGGVDDTAATE